MKTRLLPVLSIVCSILLLSSCDDNIKGGHHEPVVFGNPNTIVTETDSAYLRDLVADLQPTTHEDAPKVTADTITTTAQQPATDAQQVPPADQPKDATPAPKPAPQEKGLNIAFKEAAIVIPNIEVRSLQKQNPQTASGVTYQLKDGNVNGNRIKVASGNVTRISQRYETVIVIDNDLGEMRLDALDATSDWQNLQGRNDVYTITGLTANKLIDPKVTPATLKAAITKAARSMRLSKRKEQEWQHSVRNVRSANQRPLTTVLTSVTWRIDGKDEKGKPFQKRIRIDIP